MLIINRRRIGIIYEIISNRKPVRLIFCRETGVEPVFFYFLPNSDFANFVGKTLFMDPVIIQQKIYEIRGQKVMLDFDLALLYEVPTKALNQALKRNIQRFPADFMFRLLKEEWKVLLKNGTRSQFVTASQKSRNLNVTPYAFTEHGVTMLASILKSEKAVQMNIAIVRAFIALGQFALQYKDLADQIQEIRQTVDNHSEQLTKIYAAIELLLAEKENQKTWGERERIGFK